jgi:hypothetical protein
MEAFETLAYFVAPVSRRTAHRLVFCSARMWHEYLRDVKRLPVLPGERRKRQLGFIDRWYG